MYVCLVAFLTTWQRLLWQRRHTNVNPVGLYAQVPDEVFSEGLQLFFAIAEAMTTGMTAAAIAAGKHQETPELTAVACLMMLERVNYLISTEVQLPVAEMSDKIADIMFAAFGLAAA